MKIINKKSIILLFFVLLVTCVLTAIILTTTFKAEAGTVTTAIVDEEFDNYESIDDLDRAFVKPDKNDLTLNSVSVLEKLVLENGQYGTGFVTKNNVTNEDKVIVDLDFNSLKSMPTASGTGFISVCFGVLKDEVMTESTNWLQRLLEGGANNNSKCNEGLPCLQVRLLAESTGRYVLVVCDENGATFDSTKLKVNNNESDISIWKGKYYLTNNNMEDVSSGIFVSNKTIRIIYEKSGDLTINFVQNSVETLLCTTVGTGTKFSAYPDGKVGFAVMETAVGGVDYDMNNIVVSKEANSQTEKFAEVKKTTMGLDVSDYVTYVNPKTTQSGRFIDSDVRLKFGKNHKIGQNLYIRNGVIASQEVGTNILTIDYDVVINEIKGNVAFELGYNLQRRTSPLKNSGSSDIYIKNVNGGYVIGANKYTNLTTNIFESELTKDAFNLKIEMDFDGTTRIYIDNALFKTYQGDKPEKYVAFGISGIFVDANNYVDVEIDNVKMVNSYYARGKNTNIDEDFNNDDFNKNELYATNLIYRNAGAGGVYVKDGELYFHNLAGNSYIMTKNQYSNFEMSFDLTDIRREPVKDSRGNLQYPSTTVIGIALGQAGYLAPLRPYNIPCYILTCSIDKTTWEVIPNTTYVVAMQYNSTWKKQSDLLVGDLDVFAKENSDKTYNVKLTFIDGKVEFLLKTSDQQEYTKCLEEELEEDYTGNVGIFTEGSRDNTPTALHSCGDFVIDNLKITNKDINPDIIEVKRESSKLTKPADYVYTPRNDDEEYLIKNKEIRKK